MSLSQQQNPGTSINSQANDKSLVTAPSPAASSATHSSSGVSSPLSTMSSTSSSSSSSLASPSGIVYLHTCACASLINLY